MEVLTGRKSPVDNVTEYSALAAPGLDTGTLLEFSRILNECDDPAVIYNNVLFSLMGKLGLGRAAVALPGESMRFSVTFAKGGASRLREFSFGWKDGCAQGLFRVDALSDATEREKLEEERIEYLMPISSGGEIFAILLLGTPIVENEAGADGGYYGLLIGTIAAMALGGCNVRSSLREANRRLERRIHRLRSLFEAGAEFNTFINRDSILRLLGYTLMGEMAIRHFAVALCTNDGYELAVNRFREVFPSPVLEEVASWGVTLFPAREGLSPQEAVLYDLGVRASIPMELQGSRRGLLLAGERLSFPIDEEDAEYLSSLANLAVGALENVRLLEEMISKQKMEEDLRIAAEIQQGLLPRSLPELDGFDMAARTVPTHQVGGDCYDAIDLGGGRLMVSIADVSGKGTPASLLMANVQAAVRALAHLGLPLDEFTARINDVIYQNTSSDKFITAFFGLLDTEASRFTYVNAGHNPPYLFSADSSIEIESLDCGGVILGIMPSIIPYEVGTVYLKPGDLLLLYTDGVSEAMSAGGEEYGEDRLRGLFHTVPVESAADAVERLRTDISGFTKGAAQSDDITILALRRV